MLFVSFFGLLEHLALAVYIFFLRQLLHDSWNLYLASNVKKNIKVACYGRLCVRSILHLTGREKFGKEPKGFENLEAIAKLFIEELEKIKSSNSAASSSAALSDDGLKIENVVGAAPAQVALLQNQNMKIGLLSLGWLYNLLA